MVSLFKCYLCSIMVFQAVTIKKPYSFSFSLWFYESHNDIDMQYYGVPCLALSTSKLWHFYSEKSMKVKGQSIQIVAFLYGTKSWKWKVYKRHRAINPPFSTTTSITIHLPIKPSLALPIYKLWLFYAHMEPSHESERPTHNQNH